MPITAQHDLANISLCWMVEQLVCSKCQISFNYDHFAEWKVPTTIGQDPSTSEDVDTLNAHDTLQPITNDRPHFGHGHQLPPGPLFHSSVKRHMEDSNLKYKPKAWYKHGTEMYVS